MNSSLLKDYRAISTGGIISLGSAIILSQLEDFHLVNPAHVSAPVLVAINVLGFLLLWWVLSYLATRFPVHKIVGILSLMFAALIAEYLINIRSNPFTVPLMILFWVGVTYLILPQFFQKYKLPIFIVYGLVISYYFFVFATMPFNTENHRLDFVNFMLMPIPVFAALWGYEQWRWLKSLKADKAKAELTLLKNQINPHFFFNTLNNLYGLAVEKSDDAPAMILKLSDIMRYTIYDGKADYVALKDEVTYLEDYIELHKIRYHKQVDISFHQDLEHPHKIAPLLLIVPLENAFKHGVESLAKDAFISLKIRTTPKKIVFQITNNYEPSTAERGGIGVENLKKRLALIYPNRHRLEISQANGTYSFHLEIEPHEVPNH